MKRIGYLLLGGGRAEIELGLQYCVPRTGRREGRMEKEKRGKLGARATVGVLPAFSAVHLPLQQISFPSFYLLEV